MFIQAGVTMAVCVLTSLLMLSSSYWFVPLIGGAFCIAGILMERRSLVDLGVFATAFMYFVAVYYVDFSLMNLLEILTVYFLLFLVWILDRQAVLSRRLKLEDEKGYDKDEIRAFELSSALYLSVSVVLGFFISFIGAHIALYSSLGLETLGGFYTVPLAVVFGVAFIFIVYLIFQLLPKYIDVLEEEK